MRIVRRFATPAVAMLVALGASGCAGLSLNTGCGMGLADPMADGASRMNRGYPLAQMRMQQQAYQAKALSVSSQFSRGVYRKPGQAPLAPAGNTSSALCFR